jgi:hypothetical protein
MNYWQKNIVILKERQLELVNILSQAHIPADHQVLPSKKGAPFLQVGQQRLHSTYDPDKEGLEWAQAQGIGDQEPVVIAWGEISLIYP